MKISHRIATFHKLYPDWSSPSAAASQNSSLTAHVQPAKGDDSAATATAPLALAQEEQRSSTAEGAIKQPQRPELRACGMF